MSEFKVKISGMEQRILEEQKIESMLNSVEADIRFVLCELSNSVGNREEIKKVLKNLATKVDGQEKTVKTMRSVLTNVKNDYERTERRICGYKNDHPITWSNVQRALITIGKGVAISALNPGKGLLWLTREILKDEDWDSDLDIGQFDHDLAKAPKKWKRDIIDNHYEYDEKTKKWKKVEKDNKKKTKEEESKLKRKEILEDIKIWSSNISKEGSLLHFGKDGVVETEWGNYTYSADVMKAEAYAEAYAGLGGVGFDVGLALTALTANVGGQLGDENLGVHASGQVDVGKVSASAGGDIGLWDENGDFNPQVGFSGKLEAIAAEASGKVGVDVVGTEVNLKGSINVGIGAHADVGLHDGKISLDIGASVGVGGSVALEIDMSGTIDKVVEHAQDIGNAVSDAYEATTGFIANTANKAGDALDNIGKGFSTGWTKFWG